MVIYCVLLIKLESCVITLCLTYLAKKKIKITCFSISKRYPFVPLSLQMKDVLKIEGRDLKESIIEMAYSIIENGMVKKSKKYRGPGGATAEEEGAEGEGEGAATSGEGAEAAAANGPTEKASEEGEAKTEGITKCL